MQEYRMETPGGLAEGSETEESVPTTEPSEEAPTTEPEPEHGIDDEEDDLIQNIQDWVQDNTLLAILGVGAIGLLFLVLVIVVIIVIRRRGQGEERMPPPEVPSYPVAPPPSFETEPDEAGTLGAPGADFAEGGAPSPRTVAEGASPFGERVSELPERPPAAPPFPQPDFQPSGADRTRILKREPKMPIVGLLIDREHPEHRLDIAKPVVTVGRSRESDLVIDHNTVSRQHASIKLEEGQFHLYDLGSTNGTFVGENEVREPVPLEDGAAVRFGEKTFIFKVVVLET
jgi:hypothetical protein